MALLTRSRSEERRVVFLIAVEVAIHEVEIEIWEVGVKEDETGHSEARCASRNKVRFDGGGQGRV